MGKVNEKEMTTLIMTIAVMGKLNSLYFVRVKVWRDRLGNKITSFSKDVWFQSVIKLHYDNPHYLPP